MLALVPMGPCYVSLNTDIGFDECQKFFPEGYRNSSEVEKTKKEPGEDGHEEGDNSSSDSDDDERSDIVKELDNDEKNEEINDFDEQIENKS